jgi:hypothetical protein
MMPLLNSLARHLYRLGLRLYPLYLRRRYADQILLTLDDDGRDHRDARCRFWLRSFADLLQSSLRERLLMANDRVLARPIVTHALILGLVFRLLGVFATGVMQQLLRRGADQPQAQMASFYASEIASGVPPPEAIPRNYIDLERSLEPFVIVYDDQARPVVSTGYLNQAIPSPPSGVFRHVEGARLGERYLATPAKRSHRLRYQANPWLQPWIQPRLHPHRPLPPVVRTAGSHALPHGVRSLVRGHRSRRLRSTLPRKDATPSARVENRLCVTLISKTRDAAA